MTSIAFHNQPLSSGNSPSHQPHDSAAVKAEVDDLRKAQFERSGHLAENLPDLLRIGGAAATLLSMYFYFVKGWQGNGDLIRYLMLYAHTLLLTLLGLASGHWLKESKGARILFMLSLLSVVANFSVLGSFLYSAFGPPLPEHFFSGLHWQLTGEWQLALICGLLPLTLIPIAVFGFRVLARGLYLPLTGLFVLGNALLLIPTRDPLLVGITALLMAAAAIGFLRRTHQQRIESRTLEGLIALALLFAPLATLLVRNVWLYGGQSVLTASAALMTFLLLRHLLAMIEQRSLLTSLLELLSAGLTLICGVATGAAIAHLPHGSNIALASGTLVAAGLLYELSLRAKHLQAVWRIGAVAITTVLLGLDLMIHDTWFACLSAGAMGVALLQLGIAKRQWLTLTSGLIMAALTLISLGGSLWGFIDMNAWIGCAALGVTAILLGSFLESNRHWLQQRAAIFRRHCTDWRV